MRQPKGYKTEGKICKLNRAIYGLKESSRKWNECINEFMLKERFLRSRHDRCLYSRNENNVRTYVIVYVDDLFIASDSRASIDDFKVKLSNKYQITDTSNSGRFLGIEINFNDGNVTMSQKKYIESILRKFDMRDCRATKLPMDSNINISRKFAKENNVNENQSLFRSAIGCLNFLSNITRPDIAYQVNYLSQFSHNDGKEMFGHCKRILRYLKGTIDLKLMYRKSNKFDLVGYADSDFARDQNDRISRSGYLWKLGDNTVFWKTKKQTSRAHSSTKAEYISLSDAITEGNWIRQLLAELGFNLRDMTVYEDNRNAILYTKGGESNNKHINIKYKHINDEIMNKNVKIIYVPSADQTADMLTKQLGVQLFEKHRCNIGLINL
jgi:hypothetical protein